MHDKVRRSTLVSSTKRVKKRRKKEGTWTLEVASHLAQLNAKSDGVIVFPLIACRCPQTVKAALCVCVPSRSKLHHAYYMRWARKVRRFGKENNGGRQSRKNQRSYRHHYGIVRGITSEGPLELPQSLEALP